MSAAERFGRLNLPPAKLHVVQSADGVVRVFDRLRKIHVALTPEEWVRQHFVAMLIEELGYPEGLMANEVPLTLNGTSRRCDTVVYSREGLQPLMIVEYKAPNVALTQRVFDQIVRYNTVLRTPWLVVSNGLKHYCCRVDFDNHRVEFADSIPPYKSLAPRI